MSGTAITICHHWSERAGATAKGFGLLVTRVQGCPWCEIERLRTALKGLTDMYVNTWDRTDGALVMLPDLIPRFEAAHEAARKALES